MVWWCWARSEIKLAVTDVKKARHRTGSVVDVLRAWRDTSPAPGLPHDPWNGEEGRREGEPLTMDVSFRIVMAGLHWLSTAGRKAGWTLFRRGATRRAAVWQSVVDVF